MNALELTGGRGCSMLPSCLPVCKRDCTAQPGLSSEPQRNKQRKRLKFHRTMRLVIWPPRVPCTRSQAVRCQSSQDELSPANPSLDSISSSEIGASAVGAWIEIIGSAWCAAPHLYQLVPLHVLQNRNGRLEYSSVSMRPRVLLQPAVRGSSQDRRRSQICRQGCPSEESGRDHRSDGRMPHLSFL